MKNATESIKNISISLAATGFAWLMVELAYFVYRYGVIFFSPQFTGG